MKDEGLRKWIKMNQKFKKDRDDLIINMKKDKKGKKSKAKSKALDWFKKGQGGKGDLPPGRKDSDNE